MDSSSNPNNNINIIESSTDNFNTINNLEYREKKLQEFINVEKIIHFISSNMLSIIDKNKKDKKKQSKGINEPLYSKKIPNLSLEKFLVRIVKYTEAENNTLIVAYLYIIKLIEKENFILTINNMYRLLLGSVVLAKKIMEDICYQNSYYCEIGGLSLQELNMIEFNLFIRINFEVNSKKEDVDNVYDLITSSLKNSEDYNNNI